MERLSRVLSSSAVGGAMKRLAGTWNSNLLGLIGDLAQL